MRLIEDKCLQKNFFETTNRCIFLINPVSTRLSHYLFTLLISKQRHSWKSARHNKSRGSQTFIALIYSKCFFSIGWMCGLPFCGHLIIFFSFQYFKIHVLMNIRWWQWSIFIENMKSTFSFHLSAHWNILELGLMTEQYLSIEFTFGLWDWGEKG